MGHFRSFVITGLVPVIHGPASGIVEIRDVVTLLASTLVGEWIPGTSPAMTKPLVLALS